MAKPYSQMTEDEARRLRHEPPSSCRRSPNGPCMELNSTREEVLQYWRRRLRAVVRSGPCTMHVAAGPMDRATADRQGDLIERAIYFVRQGDWLNRLVELNVRRSREQMERMEKKPRRRGS